MFAAFVFIKIIFPSLLFLRKNQITPSFLATLLMTKDVPLKKYENRTNLLILGIPGQKHDGIDLTDSMIFLSIDFDSKDIVMVSLPRDIWIDSLKDKLNTAYHYGESKKEGGGFVMAKSAVEEVVGQPIHYSLLIDFDGFKKLIDLVGGVEVEVENSFTDSKYPISGRENDLCNGDIEYKCRYETVTFTKGVEHMDGEGALKFVRSRNAQGIEGTDFARGTRQQQVMFAFQKKLLSLENLSPEKLADLATVLKETIRTDLTLSEGAYFGKFGLTFDRKIRTLHIDWGDEEKGTKGFLVNPPVEEYKSWVLVPRTGNFDEIHKYFQCHIKNPSCSITP